MIPVERQPEPTSDDGYDFSHDIRERGEDALRQLVGLKPLRVWPGPKIAKKVVGYSEVTTSMVRKYDYWTRAMPELHRRYRGYCAYHARYLELVDVPTTDHFVALKRFASGTVEELMLAYDWANYRLAGSYINGVKAALPNVLDPFEIEEGWFALDLGNFKTVVGPRAPSTRLRDIEFTISNLKLDKDPIVTCRRRAADLYYLAEDHVPFPRLMEEQPFVAHEIQRQHRLRPEDVERFQSST